METFDFSKTVIIDTESSTKTMVIDYKVYFQDGVLEVSRLDQLESGGIVEQPLISQPWKCLPDGSRAEFVDSQDALDWLESVKDTII